MYLGRQPLGQEAAFSVTAAGVDGIPAWPSDPPFIDVWRGATLILSGLQMAKIDTSVVGRFRINLFLDRRFSVGQYRTILRWKVGSHRGVRIDHWEIVAGGHVDGAVIGMAYHEMPFASFLVQQLDSGNLVRGKNPKV